MTDNSNYYNEPPPPPSQPPSGLPTPPGGPGPSGPGPNGPVEGPVQGGPVQGGPVQGGPVQGGPGQGGPLGGFDADTAKAAFQSANRYDLGIIGAGVLAFLFSLLPYYTASAKVSGAPAGLNVGSHSVSATAWHGVFGWLAALVALAVAVVLVLNLLKVSLGGVPVKTVALAGFGVATVCVILALFVWPGEKADDFSESVGSIKISVSTGHGIGYWLSLLVILAGLALAALRYMNKEISDYTGR